MDKSRLLCLRAAKAKPKGDFGDVWHKLGGKKKQKLCIEPCSFLLPSLTETQAKLRKEDEGVSKKLKMCSVNK